MLKILSPVGDFESLKVAISEGANEIYFGVSEFNARNNIVGFTLEQVESVTALCHLFNVRAFLAVNILFSDSELEDAVNLIVKAYNLGVDAFIIQDLSLADILYKNYPNIEIHASTQMGIHNLEGVKFLEKYNFKRVVLSRETPLAEIKRIRQNSNIEIEYFVQGALCVSFSGNCYMSSYFRGASGNRGKCKQLCRLPYVALKDGKEIKKGYLLSAKDFCLINELKELENAGINSLKIEGRARRAFYVKMATRAYYNALNGKPYDMQNLKLAYNRNYCKGYFNGNGKIISNANNHIGIEIGKVINVNFGKKFNEIFIKANREITPKSILKFFDGETEICSLSAHDVKKVNGDYRITTTQKVRKDLTVNMIADGALEEEKTVLKKDIYLNISAKEQRPITVTFNVNGNTFTVESDFILQVAKTKGLKVLELTENFTKHELFNGVISVKALDNVFITKSALNAFRKKVFDKVYVELTKLDRCEKPFKLNKTNFINPLKDYQLIKDLKENISCETVIYSPNLYDEESILAFDDIIKKQNRVGYLDLPNFALSEDIEFFIKVLSKTNLGIVANNYYALTFNADKIIGWGLNVYNNYTANIFNLPLITAESQIGKQVTAPYMTLRHCPIKHLYNCDCGSCKYSNGITYKMQDNKRLKLTRKKVTTCTFYLE